MSSVCRVYLLLERHQTMHRATMTPRLWRMMRGREGEMEWKPERERNERRALLLRRRSQSCRKCERCESAVLWGDCGVHCRSSLEHSQERKGLLTPSWAAQYSISSLFLLYFWINSSSKWKGGKCVCMQIVSTLWILCDCSVLQLHENSGTTTSVSVPSQSKFMH